LWKTLEKSQTNLPNDFSGSVGSDRIDFDSGVCGDSVDYSGKTLARRWKLGPLEPT
jgi:hypothetical protein